MHELLRVPQRRNRATELRRSLLNLLIDFNPPKQKRQHPQKNLPDFCAPYSRKGERTPATATVHPHHQTISQSDVRAMSIACSKYSAPTYGDWCMALRILQWLKSSCDLGVRFCVPANATAADIVLTAYADSSLAPDWQQGDGYSVTGYVLYLCEGPVLWHSCKQTAIAKLRARARQSFVRCLRV
jgi:hypothetical protein